MYNLKCVELWDFNDYDIFYNVWDCIAEII